MNSRSALVRYSSIYGTILILPLLIGIFISKSWAGIAALSSGALILYLVYMSENDIFSPIAFVGLGYTIAYLGPGISLFVKLQSQYLLGNSVEYLLDAAFLVLFGISMLVVGYQSPIGKSIGQQIPPYSSSWKSHRAWHIVVIFSVVGLCSYFLFFWTTSFPTTFDSLSQKRSPPTNYLNWGVQFLVFATIVGFADILQRDKPGLLRVPVCILAILSASFYFFISQRTNFVFVFISLLALYHYIEYRISLRWAITISGILLPMLGLMSGLRKVSWQGLESVSIYNYILPTRILNPVFGPSYSGLPIVAHIIHMAPDEINYQFGITFIQWVVFPIPRSFWPEKPVSVGSWLSTEIYGFSSTATPATAVGELYLNFGILGVFAGMAILGIIFRTIYQYLILYPDRNVSLTIVYIALANSFIGLSDMSPRMIHTLFWLVPLIPALWYISEAQPIRTMKRLRQDTSRTQNNSDSNLPLSTSFIFVKFVDLIFILIMSWKKSKIAAVGQIMIRSSWIIRTTCSLINKIQTTETPHIRSYKFGTANSTVTHRYYQQVSKLISKSYVWSTARYLKDIVTKRLPAWFIQYHP